jgi:alkylhydroperoxidase family enzyme
MWVFFYDSRRFLSVSPTAAAELRSDFARRSVGPASAVESGKEPLPVWARMLASTLPRTTAALLELDHAQRTRSPVDPKLRAAMRWVAAHANRCDYAEAYAAFDARAAGLDDSMLASLADSQFRGWSKGDRAALEFAHKMTVASDAVTDKEFASLVETFGERQAASMVLLMAYSNFQDRLLLCLNAQVEPDGPLPPANVRFNRGLLAARSAASPKTSATPVAPTTSADDIVADEPDWAAVSYDELQVRLENQRNKPTRLRIPAWEEFADVLPTGLFNGPSDIIWYRIVFGYAPELAVPYELFMRTVSRSRPAGIASSAPACSGL